MKIIGQKIFVANVSRTNFVFVKVYTDAHGRPVPIHKNWVQIVQAYFDGIHRILLGEQTVQKAMDQAKEEIQALLNK